MIYDLNITSFPIYLLLLLASTTACIFLFNYLTKNNNQSFVKWYTFFVITYILFFFFVGPIPLKAFIGETDGQGAIANFVLFVIVNLGIPFAYGIFFLVLKLLDRLFNVSHNFLILFFVAIANQLLTYYLISLFIMGSGTF